jgi:hypothetical protein
MYNDVTKMSARNSGLSTHRPGNEKESDIIKNMAATIKILASGRHYI